MRSKLVSVIIPCYNAEKWLSDAIESCLNQTYLPIEIIIIDDGSTDSCLDIIKSYGNQIIWESGVNRGGNYARNRGFALSKGEYIQFLDADDYILPEKISRQVEFLEKTGADVVYGDWRHQTHLKSGEVFLEEIQVAGVQSDILESLLGNWWVSPACLLFTRKAVENSPGWDEELKAGQDRDFLISLALQNFKFAYQSGCYSLYRRYGNVTVSTFSKTRYLESHYYIFMKAENNLLRRSNFCEKYRKALAQSYFLLAREYLKIDISKYKSLLDKTLTLDPKFQANRKDRTYLYNIAQKIFGFRNFEKLVFLLKVVQNMDRTNL